MPDINFWLALAFEVHAHHIAAVAWFDNAGPDSCSFCRLTQQGFLRLATNRAAFRDETVTMKKALVRWVITIQYPHRGCG